MLKYTIFNDKILKYKLRFENLLLNNTEDNNFRYFSPNKFGLIF
jgi:hypothetical protein